MIEEIKLTQYSHGAGCGCKIAPNVLEEIIGTSMVMPDHARLLVGNHSKDDAAVYDLGDGKALISTTDFFMPIVDDPFHFGKIASANAISDVYAMGGKPVLAIAILGWPVNTLSTEYARKVVEGARQMCMEAGIPLAGGHSIDAPEPIFGLAVNGLIDTANLKTNNKALPGDLLFLTKPVGVGILTTAEKKQILKPEHRQLAANQMMQLNKVGEALGYLKGVHALTDVTGFGLLGHLTEMCEGSGVQAEVYLDQIPLITPDLMDYIEANSIPGGTGRNLKAYGHKISFHDTNEDHARSVLADPQTSGGLLIALAADAVYELAEVFRKYGLQNFLQPVGRLHSKNESENLIKVKGKNSN